MTKPKAQATTTAAKPQQPAAAVSEAAIILESAAILLRNFDIQIAERRATIETLTAEAADVRARLADREAEVRELEILLPSLEDALSHALMAARLTRGSPTEHSTQQRADLLENERNSASKRLSDMQTALSLSCAESEDRLASLDSLIAAEHAQIQLLENDRASIIQQRDAAFAARGQEVLAEFERQLAAIRAEQDQNQSHGQQLQRNENELRESARERLAEFGLMKDAERLAPASPAEELLSSLRTVWAILAANEGRVQWHKEFDERDMHRLIGLLTPYRPDITDFLYGRSLMSPDWIEREMLHDLDRLLQHTRQKNGR